MSKLIWIIVILAIIIGGYWYFTRPVNERVLPIEGGPGAEDINSQQPATSTSSTNIDIDAGVGLGTVKEFTVTGSNFAFTPTTMTVNKGDTVKITFKNADGTHDWKIDEFNAATKKIGSGESETIEFVADKAGTFEYYCSVGQHRAMGMKGTLVVK
ncbi:MAG TPA: cupredoxin domain-containing protein [Candidatus Paceibacterota bacterium]